MHFAVVSEVGGWTDADDSRFLWYPMCFLLKSMCRANRMLGSLFWMVSCYHSHVRNRELD